MNYKILNNNLNWLQINTNNSKMMLMKQLNRKVW